MEPWKHRHRSSNSSSDLLIFKDSYPQNSTVHYYAHAWDCCKKYTLLVRNAFAMKLKAFYITYIIKLVLGKHWKAIGLGVVTMLALFGHDICPFDLRFCAFMAVWVSF